MVDNPYAHLEEFTGYKCTKCKKIFKTNKGTSGWCSYCEKPKERIERYKDASLN